jgi:hypothetical protein
MAGAGRDEGSGEWRVESGERRLWRLWRTALALAPHATDRHREEADSDECTGEPVYYYR